MNFIEIFQQYGVDYAQYGQHEHARKGWIQTDCPYCSPGWKHFRLGFNIRGMYASCWSCGPHRIHDCLMALCGITFSECKELLGTYDTLLPETKESRTIRRGAVKLPDGIKKMRIEHRNYLLKRGLNPTTIAAKWGVKGIGLAERLQWRLFIPIFFDFETISWTTRSISDDVEKRYIKADLEDEKFPANNVLYGEDYAKHTIVVVEGIVDVWKIGPGAVATMGTMYTQTQLLRMMRFPRRIICFDADKPGQMRAKHLIEELSAFDGETFNVVLESAKDAGAASSKELKALRKLAFGTPRYNNHIPHKANLK